MSLRYFYTIAFLTGLLHVGALSTVANQDALEPGRSQIEELESQILDARERIARIDSRLEHFEKEQAAMRDQAREAHREQFSVRQRVMDEDKTIQELLDRLDVLQQETTEVQQELARLMSEHPDYVEQRNIQTAAVQHAGEAHRETLRLANERVAVQLELQALERKLAEMTEAGESASDSDEGGAPHLAEDRVQP